MAKFVEKNHLPFILLYAILAISKVSNIYFIIYFHSASYGIRKLFA